MASNLNNLRDSVIVVAVVLLIAVRSSAVESTNTASLLKDNRFDLRVRQVSFTNADGVAVQSWLNQFIQSQASSEDTSFRCHVDFSAYRIERAPDCKSYLGFVDECVEHFGDKKSGINADPLTLTMTVRNVTLRQLLEAIVGALHLDLVREPDGLLLRRSKQTVFLCGSYHVSDAVVQYVKADDVVPIDEIGRMAALIPGTNILVLIGLPDEHRYVVEEFETRASKRKQADERVKGGGVGVSF